MKLIMENWRKFVKESLEDSEEERIRKDMEYEREKGEHSFYDPDPEDSPDDLRVQAADSGQKIFVLVGPPSVGKSTWIRENFTDSEPYVINRDDIVEKVASEYGWTYDDLFMSPPPESKEGEQSDKYGTVVKSPEWMTWQPLSYDKVMEANSKVQNMFTSRVTEAPQSGQDIVIDMTNMNSGARERAMKAIEGSEEDYTKIAVVFEFEGAEKQIKALAAKRAEEARKAGRSKTIPDAAFDRMFSSFEKVDVGEGFDEVVSVDNRAMIKALIDDNISTAS